MKLLSLILLATVAMATAQTPERAIPPTTSDKALVLEITVPAPRAVVRCRGVARRVCSFVLGVGVAGRGSAISLGVRSERSDTLIVNSCSSVTLPRFAREGEMSDESRLSTSNS